MRILATGQQMSYINLVIGFLHLFLFHVSAIVLRLKNTPKAIVLIRFLIFSYKLNCRKKIFLIFFSYTQSKAMEFFQRNGMKNLEY